MTIEFQKVTNIIRHSIGLDGKITLCKELIANFPEIKSQGLLMEVDNDPSDKTSGGGFETVRRLIMEQPCEGDGCDKEAEKKKCGGFQKILREET